MTHHKSIIVMALLLMNSNAFSQNIGLDKMKWIRTNNLFNDNENKNI